MNDRNVKRLSAIDSGRVEKAIDPSCEGGLIGRATEIRRALEKCHFNTEGIRDAVLPLPPTAVTSPEDQCHPPADLTTLLNEILKSAEVLHDRLSGIRTTLQG